MEIKLRFEESKEWKAIIQALSALIKEVSFSVSDEGLNARAMDEAHIAMVDLTIPLSAFQEFHCEEATQFGISLTEMLPILRRTKGEEQLELNIDTTKNQVQVKIEAEHSTKKFSLSMLSDIASESIPVPKIDGTSSFTIDAGVFKDVIKDAEVVGDYILLKSTPDTLEVKTDGDTINAEIVIDKEAEAISTFDIKQNSAAIYALQYLSDMVKDVDSEDELRIEWSTDMPLKMEYDLLGKGKVAFFLAPRLEGAPTEEAKKPEKEEAPEAPPEPEEKEEPTVEPESDEEEQEAVVPAEAETNEEFVCETCGKTFGSKRGLAAHGRVHKE